MHELMFQAGVKGMSKRSELIPCIYPAHMPPPHGLIHEIAISSCEDQYQVLPFLVKVFAYVFLPRVYIHPIN